MDLYDFVDQDLDQNLRQKLILESDVLGDNIYSQQSQDFVNQIREDIASYIKEDNLYLQKVPREFKDEPLERQILKDEKLSASDEIIRLISKLNEEQKKSFEAKIKEREQFVPKGKPPLEDKLRPKDEQGRDRYGRRPPKLSRFDRF